MATTARPGPEREHYALHKLEADAFTYIVFMTTYNTERQQLSYALSTVQSPQGPYVCDGFGRKANKIWR